MRIDDELLDELAALAGLDLEPDERRRLAGHLERMLAQVRRLAGLVPSPGARGETEAPGAAAGPDTCPLRADEPRPSLPRAEALAGAPAHDGAFFLVPPVPAGGGGADPAGEPGPPAGGGGDGG